MTTDQAQRLRELAAGAPGRIAPPREEPTHTTSKETLFEKSPRLAHATALVSGKGGVGHRPVILNAYDHAKPLIAMHLIIIGHRMHGQKSTAFLNVPA